MLQVHHFVFNDFQENTYLLWDETLQCAIIDPGCASEAERKALIDFIRDHKLLPVLLLNTHCHIDHILGNSFVSEHFQLPLHLHEGELFTYKDTDRWAAMFGMAKFEIPEKLVFLSEGDQLTLGQSILEVLFTPGHSIASVSFYEKESQILIAGDVLFYKSIGRTDLPGGNFDRLAQSIRNVLYRLPEKTVVYPGHGMKTSIGHEMVFNPMVPA